MTTSDQPAVEPGHPFSRLYGDLIASLEQSLHDGPPSGGVLRLKADPSIGSYALPGMTPATTIDAVRGWLDGRYTTLLPGKGKDYEIEELGSGSYRLKLTLPAGQALDTDSQIDVVYSAGPGRVPGAGLSDFGPGSVADTLARAVAHELKLLYEQLDSAYRRSFVDWAEGSALDNVVALLGVQRKPAEYATGEVTFTLSAGGDTLPKGTRVADGRGHSFETTEPADLKGKQAVTAHVRATVAGPESNLAAHTVTVMPRPLRGVKGVDNAQPISGGAPAEGDEELRQRAKSQIERGGAATLEAITSVLIGIQGLSEVAVADHSVDPSVPPGVVRVTYRIAGNLAQDERTRKDAEVRQRVNEVHAAGILVEYRPLS